MVMLFQADPAGFPGGGPVGAGVGEDVVQAWGFRSRQKVRPAAAGGRVGQLACTSAQAVADRSGGVAGPARRREGMLDVVSRGPTRRVRRLLAAGEVPRELLRAADHEADLLAHPYVGVVHLELARLRLAGRAAARDELLGRLSSGVPRRWWRPRGPSSALRRRGLAQTLAARDAARRRDGCDDP